jgi:hypothetical protein
VNHREVILLRHHLLHADEDELHQVVLGDEGEPVGCWVWDVIEDDDGDYRDDRAALAAILCVVSLEMQASLAVRPTTFAAWEVIRQVHVGIDRVKEANAE